MKPLAILIAVLLGAAALGAWHDSTLTPEQLARSAAHTQRRAEAKEAKARDAAYHAAVERERIKVLMSPPPALSIRCTTIDTGGGISFTSCQ